MKWRLLHRDNTDWNLPDALVVGPQKAGTTWIYHYLLYRGDVAVPQKVKETFFFDRRYNRGLRWYAKHFPKGNFLRTVEVAPTYFHRVEVPQRVRQDLGLVPIVCTLREPVSRAFSLYLHLRHRGLAQCTFREAVKRYPIILESSRYAECLSRWIQQFGREQIAVLFLEQLAAAPSDYAMKLCSHLNISFVDVPPQLRGRINAASNPASPLLARIGYYVAEAFRSMGCYSVVNLAKRLGLKPIFFGKPGATNIPKPSQQDADWFLSLIHADLEMLAQLLPEPVPEWLSRWKHSGTTYQAKSQAA